jgi:hypothetical protein
LKTCFSLVWTAIVENIVDGVAEATFASAFGTQAGASAIYSSSIAAAGMPDHSHPNKAGFFKEGTRSVAESRERLDPVHRAELTGSPNESRGNPRAPIIRMQDDPLQQPELGIEGLQGQAGTGLTQAEPAVAPMQGGSRGAEDADANRPLAMPEHDHLAYTAEVMTAIMPPSEVRPIAHGTVRKPQLRGK